MKPRAAKTRFLKRLEAAGLALEDLTPSAGVEAMLSYYADERAEGCPVADDGDMLLFQWGTYDWGEGPAFEVDLTRQLIHTDTKAEKVRQLRLTFRFEPSVGAAAGEQNRWCLSPAGLAEFREFVIASEGLRAAERQRPVSVRLLYGPT